MENAPILIVPFLCALLCGGLCAYLGNFVLMRQMTFVSMALAQSAALGVAFGALFGVDAGSCACCGKTASASPLISPEGAALVTAGLAAFFFHRRAHSPRPWHESSVGVVYVFCAALALVLVAQNPLFEARGLDALNGNLLYCTPADLKILLLAVLAVAGVHALFFRDFIFLCVDRESAQAFGLNTRAADLLFMTTLAAGVALSMKAAGVLFVFASLVVPPLVCMSLFGTVRGVFLGAVAVVPVCVTAGIAASFRFDFPASPTIVCCYVLLLGLAALWKRFFRPRT